MDNSKITRNILAALDAILLLPLIWHGIAPISVCWLQDYQMGVCALCAFLCTILVGVFTLDL